MPQISKDEDDQMSAERAIPIPPLELRQLVGPPDPAPFDNPSGEPIYPELPSHAYEAVFDFGCGCGRMARRLLQQKNRPRRYVGIDVHRGMIQWCIENLSSVDPSFQFFHHDVYSPGYAPDNSYRLAEPFPVGDGEFSLVIAHSVFTHIYKEQTEFYLYEIARILKAQGVAWTSWFFFDKESFPFLQEGPYCLFTNEVDPAEAVIYDREWFVDAVRRCKLAVRQTEPPAFAGHQWRLHLEKRRADSVDRFPLGDEGAEWLCGATRKPAVQAGVSQADRERAKVEGSGRAPSSFAKEPFVTRPSPPTLRGPIAELASVKAELEAIRRSWLWKFLGPRTKSLRR